MSTLGTCYAVSCSPALSANRSRLGEEEKEIEEKVLGSDEEIEEEGGEGKESEGEGGEGEGEGITSVKKRIKKGKGGSSVSDNTTKKSQQQQNTEKLKDEEDSENEDEKAASLIKRVPTPDGLGFFERWQWHKDKKAVGRTFEPSKEEKKLKKQQKKAADAEAKRKSDRGKLQGKAQKIIDVNKDKIKKLDETNLAIKKVFGEQEHNANASPSFSSSSSSLSSSSSTNNDDRDGE
ncbi:MAG: hypothetical protein LE178_05685 [Endomicrobium sp.]|nr:hypothetical protein [Endomicrobium sp.]